MGDDESGSLLRPEAVVQDAGGALVHVSTWTVDGGLHYSTQYQPRDQILGTWPR